MSPRWRPPPRSEKVKGAVDEDVLRYLLKVNPDMRKGRSTDQLVTDLAGTAETAEVAPAERMHASGVEPARFREMIATFLEQKGAEATRRTEEIDAQLAELKRERETLRAAVADEIVDFLCVIDRGAFGEDTVAALRAQAPLLKTLGLDEAGLRSRVKRKGKR